LGNEQIVGLELVPMRLAQATFPLLLIKQHMMALRAINPTFANGRYMKFLAQIEAQGDMIRANGYAFKMREYDQNTLIAMMPKRPGQAGYMLNRDEKLKSVTLLGQLITECRLKIYKGFVSVGKQAFIARAETVNRSSLIATFKNEFMRLRHDTKTGVITGKDGPNKQDDGVTTTAVGIFKATILRRGVDMSSVGIRD
jgi:hypothetical protein